MKSIKDWLANLWPRHRLMPTERDVRNGETDYLNIPDSLIEAWIERTQFQNPQSTDPYICVAWAARCDFVETIVKIRDKAANPSKYDGTSQAPVVGAFDPRRAA